MARHCTRSVRLWQVKSTVHRLAVGTTIAVRSEFRLQAVPDRVNAELRTAEPSAVLGVQGTSSRWRLQCAKLPAGGSQSSRPPESTQKRNGLQVTWS